jgi:hypothetical protein
MFILSLAGLALFIFLLNLLSSTIQQWIGNEPNAADVQKASTKDEQDEQGQPVERVFIDRIESIANAIHAYNNKRDYHERRRSRRETNTIIALSAAAIFAFLTAGAAFYSDWIFSDQLEEMRQDRRAWVGPTHASLDAPVRADVGLSAIVALRNTGREPSLKTTIEFDPVTVGIGEPNIHDIEKEFADRCKTTGRKTAQHIAIYPTSSDTQVYMSGIKITAEKIDWDVVYGLKYILIRACVGYETANELRYSAFCYFYQSGVSNSSSLALCDEGNDAN